MVSRVVLTTTPRLAVDPRVRAAATATWNPVGDSMALVNPQTTACASTTGPREHL